MRFVLAAAAALTACSTLALAKPPEGPSRTFRPADLFGLEWASDPQARPDGGAIAYVRSTHDIMTDKPRRSIWLVDPATGAQTPLVTGAASASNPRWSPDGKRLAYVSAAEDDRPQLFVRYLANGAAARVATLPQGPSDIAWSPDGRFLAFTMFVPDEGVNFGAPMAKPEGAKWADPLKVITRLHYRQDSRGYLKPGYDHVFVVAADGGSPRQLTFGAYDDQGPLSWSGDSRTILFSSNRGKDPERDPLNSEVFQVSVTDASARALTTRRGPDGNPRTSPDGSKIAYIGWDDRLRGYENAQLYVMNADGSGSRSLTAALDRSVDDVRWAADGRSLYIQYADRAVTKVARVGLDGRITPVAEGVSGSGLDRPYSGGEFSVSNNGLVALTVGAPDHPSDIGVAGRDGARRLTRLNEDLFAGKTLGRVERLAVMSTYDKRPIDAWVVTPPGFDPSRKYPLILEIHGGPFASYGPYFSTDYQLYAAAGYVVVYSNPRGSTSYGEEFANQIHHAYPGHDYDDLMSVVDATVARGFVDPDQLFVTGGSGGGVLTTWIIGNTNRFKAAVVQKPVINWSSFVLTADEYNVYGKYWFGKMPWEDPQGYWKRSPISLVGNISTPTMVVVGEEDYRTPSSEAEQLYQALQLRGVPTAFVKVPGASHGGIAARPSQSGAKANAIIAWFDRYRAGAGATQAAAGAAPAAP
ncbi:MAG TPA: S9 family peptidase [Caulobacteraceae bacterium]|jgi:dipeptidyl aminopeptidase/acylaminoacyl peptidase